MKRFVIAFIIFLAVPSLCFAGEYEDNLSAYDLSFFEESLDKEAYKALDELGLTDFDYDSITSLSLENVINVIKSFLFGKTEAPIKSCTIILLFILISSLIQSFRIDSDSTFSEIYSTATALIIVILTMSKLGDVISLSQMAISVAANFIYAFLPTFCAIVVASGGITSSFSTNSMLLMLSQGLSFLSSNLFMPVINCFLALGICSSLRYELHLDRLLKNIKKIITTCISFISAAFVSILSIKTAVASKTDALGLRSIRFAINSVVPVIGSAISEGLLSIQSYSSLIKSSVGVVGIIAVALIFLPSIIGVVVWRLGLSLCKTVADTFDDRNVSMVLNAFVDGLLLINVILILSMVTTIISIGILIAAGG